MEMEVARVRALRQTHACRHAHFCLCGNGGSPSKGIETCSLHKGVLNRWCVEREVARVRALRQGLRPHTFLFS